MYEEVPSNKSLLFINLSWAAKLSLIVASIAHPAQVNSSVSPLFI